MDEGAGICEGGTVRWGLAWYVRERRIRERRVTLMLTFHSSFQSFLQYVWSRIEKDASQAER